MKNNPLAKLDREELVWLFGILKDACRERLEKNLISQMLEDRLYRQHGPVPGRIDPRPKLKQWEPRYRKFLEVATEIHDASRLAGAGTLAQLFAERLAEATLPTPPRDTSCEPKARIRRAGSPSRARRGETRQTPQA